MLPPPKCAPPLPEPATWVPGLPTAAAAAAAAAPAPAPASAAAPGAAASAAAAVALTAARAHAGRPSLLLRCFEVQDLREKVIGLASLRCKRALACTTRQFRAQLYPTLRAPRLVVRAEDATLRMRPSSRGSFLRRLVVEGEVGYPDGWEVASSRGCRRCGSAR